MCTPSIGTSLQTGDSEIQVLSSCGFNIFSVAFKVAMLFFIQQEEGEKTWNTMLGKFSELRLDTLVIYIHTHCLSLNHIATYT